VKEQEVLVASTGMIGVELPMAPIRSGMEKIELARDGGGSFARAIITTDTHTKEMAVSFKLGGKACTIGAAAKGAGMIHPNMATMLCFIATDAAVAPGFLQPALKAAADRSFNQITVDGDTSTSDTVVLLANGKAGNKPIAAGAPEAALFSEALTAVCVYLAKSIARDGEGATKLIEVQVESAASWEDARLAARTIAASPLVKSAVHGADPNWGRVMAALGRSGAKVEESKVALAMNDIWMFDNGAPVPFFQEAARVSMQEPEVRIVVRLNQGKHSATAWGCDLTEDYVRFNSEYTT
jgi:glutamate N-acetyltransferase/amino-acid N-acetyltransferase